MRYIPDTNDFILPVNHRVQLDNTGGEGYRECFLTCSTMLADYLLQGWLTREAKRLGLAEPEDVYATCLAKYGDTTDWNAHVKALADLKIESYVTHSASLSDVSKALYRGIPVIIGTKYKASGHIVLVVGRNSKGFTILCPNGIRHGASNNWERRFYSEAEAVPDQFSWTLLKRIFTDLGDEAGWALIVNQIGQEKIEGLEGL